MATRGSYDTYLYGHPDNVSFMQFSTKIDGFEQKIHRALRTKYNSYEQYPLEKLIHFHHLPITILWL